MTWILSIAGMLLSLFLGGGSGDSYYQGMCHGIFIASAVSLGLYLMNKLKFWELCIAVGGLYFAFLNYQKAPIILPNQTPPTPVRRPLLPFRDDVQTFTKGGPVAPDGKTEVECDLPTELRKENVGGRDGAGLCVFTSIMHAARYQDVHDLEDFQDKMRKEPGGGYPEKVDTMMKKYAPKVRYVQHTGGDAEFLRLALRTGRMPSVTYSGKDNVYYKQKVAHMVNLTFLDKTQASILDNNYIDGYLWMTDDEFIQRWKDMNGGWAVVLLDAPPPQPPYN